ncbi:MAG: T9SS type A sorting domain-containing protein, partial [Paraprevotella sp.]|nr:T9SS type A sorting domain-containing protein [Paraprevotella sp.]
KMSVVVEQDGVNIDVSEHLYFNDNAVLGTPAQPYVIQLDERAAMQSIMMEQDDRFITITATQPLSHVSMYNTKGQMVHHYSEQGSSIRIPTSSLSQGAYIISAKTTNGTQRTFKMVK